jgi:AbrB family looped-hinge helix DNA binding protein
MSAVSVTSKGQVTIPKKVRQAFGITPGSKVEFNLKGGEARLTLARKGASSRVEDGPGSLKYAGRPIPVSEIHGGVAMKKAFTRARR